MAEVRRQSYASLATLLPCNAHQITGKKAGEALLMGEFVYIKTADGLVYKGDGTDNTLEANFVIGVAADACPAGEAITIHRGVRYAWAVKGTPVAGKPLYLSAVHPGELADAAGDTGSAPVAFVVDDSGRIQLIGTCG